MYSIMIVDDESAIRKGLVHFMPWDSMNCRVVATASDGMEAMVKLKEEPMDIVITDIRMPGMNGLELSKYLYENYPSIKIIILTAHSDFEYSQTAIKYGALDFILKPTSIDKFQEAIKKAISMILREREDKKIIESLKNELSQQTEEIQENHLFKIMHGIDTDPIVIEQKCKSAQIKLENFLAVVAQVNLNSNSKQSISNNSILSAKKLFPSFFKDFSHYIVIIDQHHIGIFMNIDRDNTAQDTKDIFGICQELSYIAKNLNKIEIQLGISQCHKNVTAVAAAYQEALSALSNDFFENNSVYQYQNNTNKSQYPSISTDQIEQCISLITKLVQAGKYADTLEVLDRIFSLHRNTNQTIESTKHISILIYSLILGLIPKQRINATYISQKENICTHLWQSKSLDDLYGILSTEVQSIISDNHKDEAYAPSMIDKIDEYIMEHYHENISLTSVADHVHLNSSYLSRLYKKETNLNLTEKITTIRMEKAKLLLKTTDLKIYELASLVGIENPTYFSILFNKYTGQYPKEYRHSR